jgi:hypothetical protein
LETRTERFRLAAGKRRRRMDTVRRGSGATTAPLTVNETFWTLVDEAWPPEELAELVALCKAIEDAYRRACAIRERRCDTDG